MPGNLDTNGNLLFFTPAPPQTVVESAPSTTSLSSLSGLYACNIVTDVLGESIKIQVNNIVYFHIELSGIVSMDIAGSTITLKNIDQLPISLSFTQPAEAQKALLLLEDAIDGEYINCTDSILTSNLTLIGTTSFSYPCLVFANNIVLGKANNSIDVINLLNVFGKFNYITIQGGNDHSFIIDYTAQYEKFVPTSISFVNTFFTCEVNSNTVSCSIDYTTQDKFWTVANGQAGIGNPTTKITFPNPSNNSFDVFYINPFLNLLDLNNNSITSIIGTLPYNTQTLNLLSTNLIDLSFLSNISGLKSVSISQSTALDIDFTDNTQLTIINLLNSAITTITGTDNLTKLNSFKGVNLNIASTPNFSSSGGSLKTLEFDQCNYITSLSSIASNTNLTSYTVNGSLLSVSSVDITSNINLKTLVISNSSLSTFPSLATNTLLSFVDVSFDDMLSSSVEGIVQDLTSHATVRNGTLTLSNQVTPIDYALLPDPFTANLNYLRNILNWVVNL